MSRVDWALLPESLKELSVKKGKLFSEAGKAHYALSQRNVGRNPEELSAADVEANAELAAVVVKNFEEVQQIWDEIDHFTRHRQVKGLHPYFKVAEARKSAGEMSDVELLKQLRNLPSNMLKYTKIRIPAAAGALQRQKLEAKVSEWQAALQAARSEAEKRGLTIAKR
jgi:hypothetical protein